MYRRRENGPVIDRLGRFQNVDCTWVVPYNPYLLRRYACHLNVQLATSIQALKYIYKYIYKGYDKCEVIAENEEFSELMYEIGRAHV